MKIAFLSSSVVSVDSMTRAMAPYPICVCRDRSALAAEIGDADVLIVQNKGFPYRIVDDAILARAGKLRLIQHHGVAHDATDIDAARRRDIMVATTSAANSESVAELAFHLLLCLAKRVHDAQRSLREGRMGEVLCTELAGKTLCIVGFGRIGTIIARMARGFSMTVIAVKRTPNLEEARAAGADAVYAAADLKQALREADFVLLALPLNDSTFDLIGTEEFSAMKPGAGLVNISRGPNVNRAALEDALAQGRLSGFAADVYWTEPAPPEDPLLRDDRVIITPHIGAESSDAIDRMSAAVRTNIDRFLHREPLTNVVEGTA